MKTKDAIELVVAVVIVIVAGYFIYSFLAPKPSSASAQKDQPTIVKVTPINPQFNQAALKTITQPQQVRDFYSPPDLNQGLGNPSPFQNSTPQQ